AAAVQHCRPDDPDDVSAAFLLLSQQLGHARVVDGLLARDLAAHELELATALRAAEKTGRVDEDAFAAILGVADRDRLTLPDVTTLGDAQAIRVLHNGAVHARRARQSPLAVDLHVRRQVRRRKEVIGQYAIGGSRLEAGIGRVAQARLVEIRWIVTVLHRHLLARTRESKRTRSARER